MVWKVLRERQDQLVQLERKVIKVHQEQRDLRVPKDQMDSLE